MPDDPAADPDVLRAQFDALSAELRAAYQLLEGRVANRTRALAALNAIAEVVSRSLDLEEVLAAALDKTLEVMGMESGEAFRLGDDGLTLRLLAHRGLSDAFVAQAGLLPLSEALGGDRPADGPVVRRVDAYPPGRSRARLEAEGLQLLVAIPLTAKGRLLGMMYLGTRAPRALTESEEGLLAAVGQQVGVAVENARLYEQAEQLAVIQERSRLARDLHDSVTQSLYSLTLFAEAGRRQLAAGDAARAEASLAQLGETARQALREMRLLVYELRPLVLETEGLVGALRQRLDAVERRSGVRVHLAVEGAVDLPASVEEALYRIGQEALNNALKHAQATEITVRLWAAGDAVTLEVEDDGRGFGAGAEGAGGGIGLASMRERAERLGGAVEVLSVPGEGTRVSARLPTGDPQPTA